jgi:outer membrane receptor protein involved in Fe transport
MNTHTYFKKKMLASFIKASFATFAICTSVISIAASSDANLRGHAAAGAVITAKQIATGATRRTTADKDGSYALVGLPPGTYQVDAGAGTERTVTLTVASTATLDLVSTPSTATTPSTANTTNLKAVSVSAQTLREVKTSEVGTQVSLHDINTIPEASRNFLEFADTVPGMVFTRSANGNTTLQSGAQASSAINVYIDGVGQKNYILPGGTTGQNNSQGNPFPQLAIAEYKVITSNYKAEYDQISSAAVTAETKSGTNEYHGDVFGSFTNTAMRAETPSEEASGHKTASHEKDYGFDFGGPIAKDMAHFYIAYEGKEFDTPITVVPGGDQSYLSQLPASAQAQLGTASLPFKENDWFGKIDFEPSDKDRFEISGKYRHETSLSGIGGTSSASAALDTINTDKRFDVRWDHSTDSWFNRLQATYEDAFYTPTPVFTGDGATYVQATNRNQTILTTGNSPLAQQDKGQKGPSLQDDLTFNDFEWNGDHVIKMGVKYKLVRLTAQDSGDSNALYSYAVTQANGTEAIPFQVQFGSPTPGLSPVATSSDRQFGTYIQDDWAVNDHLTVNLGVRWDYEKTPSYLDYVTPANVVAAFNMQDPNAPAGQTYAQTLAKGGVNVNDYISTGNNRRAPTNEFQPRLGFSYDINGDEKHVFFGGVGRSYDRDLYESLQVEQTKSVLSQPQILFNTPLEPCTLGPSCLTFDPRYLNISNLQALVAGTTAGKEVDMINNNLKAPYSDQFSIGMRNSFGDWNTSATIARILSYDGLVFTLGDRYPNGSFWQNGGQPFGNGIPGFGAMIIGNNGLETRNTQVLLEADKPFTNESGWGTTIAYTYSHAKQNNDNNDPTDQYAFDYEKIGNYPFTNAGVAKNRLVATGSFAGPWGFVLGAKLTLATPIPDLNLACYGAPATGQDANGINGAGCRSVSIVPPGNGKFLIGGKIYGDRDIDFQATKNFKVYGGLNAYVRFDLLNAFNWNNYVNYIENFGSNGTFSRTPVIYNPTGDITGYPRTVKLSMGLSF